MPPPRKSVGFTLAEVLITLGIIGVVASITLPTLINNFKNQQYVNQLKKSYSEMSNTFKYMLAKEEVESLDETEFFANFPAETQNIAGVPEYLDTALGKYFKVLKTCHTADTNCNPIKYSTLHGNPLSESYVNNYNFYTAGGQIIYFSELRKQRLPDEYNKNDQSAGCPAFIGSIGIDVNGEKGPNRWGRDYFSYKICVNGKLFPQGGKELATGENGINYGYWWKTGNCCSEKFDPGHGCTGRVMEQGWKMDY